MKRRRPSPGFAAIAFGVLGTFIAITAAQAEVVYLKNGDVIVGRIIGQSRTQMRLRTDKGVRAVPKSSIRRVSYSRAEEQAILNRRREAERRKQLEQQAREEENERARREAEREAADQSTAGDASESDTQPISPGGLVLRSAVVPGLGHLSAGDTFTGVAYMGLNGLALANLIVSRNGALAAEQQNNDDVVLNLALTFVPNGLESLQRIGINFYLNSIAQEPYRQAIRRYDQSILLLAGAYLFQLTHIIYDAYFRPASGANAAGRPPGHQAAGWSFSFAPVAPGPTARSAGNAARSLKFAGRLRYTAVF